MNMPVRWRTYGMDLFGLQKYVENMSCVCKLQASRINYFIWYIFKLKRVRRFPDRPKMRFEVDESERFDFDEAMLPEDSWKRSLGSDEFELEKIMDVHSGRKTRYGRIHREFLIRWKRYSDPSWIDSMDLNCGAYYRSSSAIKQTGYVLK